MPEEQPLRELRPGELYPGEFPEEESFIPTYLQHYEVDWNHIILLNTLRVYFEVNRTEIVLLQKLEIEIERLIKLVRWNHGFDYVEELRESWSFPRNIRYEINNAELIELACDLLLLIGIGVDCRMRDPYYYE